MRIIKTILIVFIFILEINPVLITTSQLEKCYSFEENSVGKCDYKIVAAVSLENNQVKMIFLYSYFINFYKD